MPVLHQQSSTDPEVSSVDSTVGSPPFMYGDLSPTSSSMMSISDLLGLNMPRGTTLGQTPQNPWSPPAASTPAKHQGMRPPCFSSFNTQPDSGYNSLDTPPHQRGMPQANSGGYDLTQPFSPVSPSYTPRAIRGSPPYSDCSSPLMEQVLLQSWTSRSNSPSDSDTSNVTSNDISDIMNSLNISQPIGICSPPTEQELANLRALHTIVSNPVLRSVQGIPPMPMMYSYNSLLAQNQLESGRLVSNESFDHLENDARRHRNQAASSFEHLYQWRGDLPSRFLDNPTIFSCKVFLGGVPWDVTEETLICVFSQFGKVRVEWPGKEQAASQPKGYVYIIFESEKQVKALLSNCTRDFTNGVCENWYFRISSRKMKSKEVQVIPWCQSDSNFVQSPSQKLDPHTTVFVGALHGMLNAEGLFRIMNELFGGVVYAGIDTDKFKYPIGSARVTFNNRQSYMHAVLAAFIEIKTTKFTKKVQVDPYLEDSPCSNCIVQQGPYFCRELTCFRYFCRSCWNQQHQFDHNLKHKPLMRSSKNNNTSPPQMRFTQQ